MNNEEIIEKVKGMCKNCNHPIIRTTYGWSHQDTTKQPNHICKRPLYSEDIPLACNCVNPELKVPRSKIK